MRNFFKRAAAGAVALAMCAGLAGCYSEDKTWAAKLGEDTLPIGGYIYYLSSAYSQGASEVGTDTDVLNATIEDQNAQDWIKDAAMDSLYSYYFVSQKFNELGLSLDEEDQTAIENATSSMWGYFRTPLEPLGVAQSSFRQAYSVYNMKLKKLMLTMYGKSGEMELSEDELREYYSGNYTYYQYFLVNHSTTDDDGNSTPMEDDEKAEIKERLDDYVELINNGRQTLDEAAANYANASSTEPNLSEPVSVRTSSMSALFADALKELDNDKATLVDASSYYYVVQKLDVSDGFEALLEDQDRMDNLILEMKQEEFLDYTMEQGANVGVEVNQKAIASVKLSKVADAMGKKGVSSEASSSEASETSSEESSEESSDEESASSEE